jgi:hypothetical protein
MTEEHVAGVLAAYTDGLIGKPETVQPIPITDEEHGRLAPLFQLAGRLQQSMRPVQPSAAFVRNLRRELADNARRRIALTKRLRRSALIGAAALGSLLSIASVVGAIVFVVARLRARAQETRAIQAPTG